MSLKVGKQPLVHINSVAAQRSTTREEEEEEVVGGGFMRKSNAFVVKGIHRSEGLWLTGCF